MNRTQPLKRQKIRHGRSLRRDFHCSEITYRPLVMISCRRTPFVRERINNTTSQLTSTRSMRMACFSKGRHCLSNSSRWPWALRGHRLRIRLNSSALLTPNIIRSGSKDNRTWIPVCKERSYKIRSARRRGRPSIPRISPFWRTILLWPNSRTGKLRMSQSWKNWLHLTSRSAFRSRRSHKTGRNAILRQRRRLKKSKNKVRYLLTSRLARTLAKIPPSRNNGATTSDARCCSVILYRRRLSWKRPRSSSTQTCS